MQWQALALQAVVVALVAAFMYLVRPKKGSTFLIDFYCLRPPNRYPADTCLHVDHRTLCRQAYMSRASQHGVTRPTSLPPIRPCHA